MSDRRLPFVIMDFGKNMKGTFLAIKEVLDDVLNLSPKERQMLRVDDIMSSEKPEDRDSYGAPDRTLQAIRDSLFIVCDTTGNRPNVFFELGYALGRMKHVFVVHHKESDPPPLNVRDAQPHYYHDIQELQLQLKESVSKHFCARTPPLREKLDDFFDRCQLPFFAIEGDGTHDYDLPEVGRPGVTITWGTKKEFDPPEAWRGPFDEVLRKRIAEADAGGGVLFPGALVRLLDCVPDRDEKTGKRYMNLAVQPTDYFSFIKSNHAFGDLPPDDRKQLREGELRNRLNLRDSALANPLTVDMAVVAEHEGKRWLLIQERNVEKVFHAKYRYQCSAAGMLNADRDKIYRGFDPYKAARNEISEELGFDVREDMVKFLALVRETDYFEVGLVGVVHVHEDPDHLLKPPSDGFEVVNVLKCEFTPEAYAQFIMERGGLESFVRLGLAASVFALIRYFGVERVESSMRCFAPDK